MLRQHDSPEGAGAEGLQPVEVLEACRILKEKENGDDVGELQSSHRRANVRAEPIVLARLPT